MSEKEPNITIPVDLTNPGQFFACCGLLELASRIDGNAEACFEERQFVVRTSATDVLLKFFHCAIAVDTSYKATDPDEQENEDHDDEDPEDAKRGRTFPMRLLEPFDLLLNWWTDKDAQGQKLKLWTAGQRVTDLLNGHYKKKKQRGRKGAPDKIIRVYTPSTREHFAKVVADHPNDWLQKAVPIDAPAAFSFDSRLSRNNALDLGHFSGGTLAFSPAVDVLSLIGLQRCRPETVETWNRNRYCTWSEFIPVTIAPLAVLGRIPSLIDLCFEFPVKARDSQGRFKLFGHAQPTRRPYV
jgi:CRISPR-associated protein Csx14